MAGSIQGTEVVLKTISLGLTTVTGPSGCSGEVLTAISTSFSSNTNPAGCYDWLEERFPREQDRKWKDEVIDLSRDALHFFKEAAVLGARSHDKEDRVRLLALGGRLTRAKALPGLEAEREKILSEIEALKEKRRRLRWHAQESGRSGQYFWHRAIVLVHAILPQVTRRRRSRDIDELCKRLSIPELGIRCTRDTIKAARRRFYVNRRCDLATREEFSQLVYTSTLRSAGTDKLERQGEAPGDQEEEPIQELMMGCRPCGGKRIPVLDCPSHLELVHGKAPGDIYKPRGCTEILDKGTNEVLMTLADDPDHETVGSEFAQLTANLCQKPIRTRSLPNLSRLEDAEE
jgi:hypothetical protein